MTLIVNGHPIAPGEIEREFQRLRKVFTSRMPERELDLDALRDQAKQVAIGRRLLLEEALRRNIEPDEGALEREIESLRKQLGGEAAFEEHLRRRGTSLEAFRGELSAAALVDRLVSRLAADATEPTEDDALNYFELHADEFVKTDCVRIRHILVKADAKKPGSRETARKTIEALRKQILDGANFAELAARFSDCPTGEKSGGELGEFGRGQLTPDCEKAVYEMDVGGVSEPVASPLGYHLFRKDEHHHGTVPLPFDAVKGSILRVLRETERNKTVELFVERLKNGAEIDFTS
ncbi:MAG: peptidylprolyl isomerase [Lentisphaerae bacterium]|nr:peptidylprolyl isomerase [Lentisphaerota bacterium]